jgi:three-Cys-motif partner protein
MLALDPPVDDGLLIPEVGPWSADKHYFLRRYIDVFTTGMKSRGWKGLHYIDLFASAGIERLKSDGSLHWASPLIAAQAPNRFTRLHICEINKRRFQALEKRIARVAQPQTPRLINDDANHAVHEIIDNLPARALSLAFLDPTGLHLHFGTLRALAQRRVDLIIFWPDHLDALRNWEALYKGKPDSNLTKVLDTDSWEDELRTKPQSRWAESLRLIYEKQIATLGYVAFDHERITLPNGRHLYMLLFCSKHERGGEFWKKIAKKKPGGQQTFEF